MTTWFISRHPGAIAWAQEQGLRVDRLAAHLDVELVQPGDVIIGTLPVNLVAQVCALGAGYLNLSLTLPADWRGRELSADELRACNARLEAYQVTPAEAAVQGRESQGSAC